mmetsp:Transcript_22658/g.70951  ORF Transcript_22658/g.70951 Transcript_22658/m.70951 type:complete len:87 (-) Transcript_22658:13-273(-)
MMPTTSTLSRRAPSDLFSLLHLPTSLCSRRRPFVPPPSPRRHSPPLDLPPPSSVDLEGYSRSRDLFFSPQVRPMRYFLSLVNREVG